MEYPEFFNDVEHIILKDELSKFLGTNKDGIIDISFLEIVKMAGHSCAVVAGTYLMAKGGLKALYGQEIPKRGEIKVELKGTTADNTGVSALILSNITGATENMGFKGIMGKFNRRGLLFMGSAIQSDIRFTRLDTNKSVEVVYKPWKVVSPGDILQSAIGPDATEESKRTFPDRWQNMVKTILENADKVIEIVE